VPDCEAFQHTRPNLPAQFQRHQNPSEVDAKRSNRVGAPLGDFARKQCDFADKGPAKHGYSFPHHECKAKPSIGEFGLPVPGRTPVVLD
jgi:hypothetical protein